MSESAGIARLQHLEPLGDATAYSGQMHTLIERSPLFENFNLAEIRLMSNFMRVYRAESGIDIIRPTMGGWLENLAPPLGQKVAAGAVLGRVVSP